MLTRNLSEMTEIDIDMPDYLQVKVLLLIINRRSTNYAIQFLHKVPPVLPLKHSKASVLNSEMSKMLTSKA